MTRPLLILICLLNLPLFGQTGSSPFTIVLGELKSGRSGRVQFRALETAIVGRAQHLTEIINFLAVDFRAVTQQKYVLYCQDSHIRPHCELGYAPVGPDGRFSLGFSPFQKMTWDELKAEIARKSKPDP